jgi:hypothetical protein
MLEMGKIRKKKEVEKRIVILIYRTTLLQLVHVFVAAELDCRAPSTISGVRERGTMFFVGGLKSESAWFGKAMTTKRKERSLGKFGHQ